jgi:hypothetical protein
MKTYINQKPPGWKKKPDAPVIIVSSEEEEAVRDNLYAFSDMWRKVGHQADKILNHNDLTDHVDICNERGEVIRTIERPKLNKPG